MDLTPAVSIDTVAEHPVRVIDRTNFIRDFTVSILRLLRIVRGPEVICHAFRRLVRPLNAQPLTVVDIIEDVTLVLPKLAMLVGEFPLARLLHSQALYCFQTIIDVELGQTADCPTKKAY